jgi:uncharacterized protein YndB with AHSA1/START domain
MDQHITGTATDARYVLDLSRIFDATPAQVYQAFSQRDLRARWITGELPDSKPELDAGPAPDAGGQPGDAATDRVAELSWRAGPAEFGSRETSVLLRPEAGGKTLLDLREGPYTEDEETDARARWNAAFSHLDTILTDTAAH